MLEKMDIQTFSSYMICIVNVFLIPVLSLIFEQKIKSNNSSSMKPFYRFIIYLLSVFILSRLAVTVVSVISGDSIAIYSLLYTLVALVVSLFVPVFFKLLASHFKVTLRIKENRNEEQNQDNIVVSIIFFCFPNHRSFLIFKKIHQT